MLNKSNREEPNQSSTLNLNETNSRKRNNRLNSVNKGQKIAIAEMQSPKSGLN